MFKRIFKLTLAAVLLTTLAAAPAGAQGDDPGAGTWFLYFAVVAGAFVLVVAGAVILAGTGLDHVIPDAPFKLAEESVDISLSAGRAEVSAEYVFRNDGKKDKELSLNYPFGEGRGVGPAEDVMVTDGAGAEVPFEWKGKNIIIEITVPAKSEAALVVKYGQPLSGTAFTYLLGKDRFWRLGGAFTTFTVKADAALGEIDSVYGLKKVAGEEGCTSYVYVHDEFFPDNSFTLSWKETPPAAP
jgi:hypothetical protein